MLDGSTLDCRPALGFDMTTSVVHLLHRAGRYTGESFVAQLVDQGLTPRQLVVLMAVADHDGLSQAEIGAATGIDRATIVDVVRRLMGRGFLHRRRNRLHGRAYVVRITDDGRRIVTAAVPEAARVDQQILTMLPPLERAAFVCSLSRIVDAMRQAADGDGTIRSCRDHAPTDRADGG